jgi:hypothetical protein
MAFLTADLKFSYYLVGLDEREGSGSGSYRIHNNGEHTNKKGSRAPSTPNRQIFRIHFLFTAEIFRIHFLFTAEIFRVHFLFSVHFLFTAVFRFFIFLNRGGRCARAQGT